VESLEWPVVTIRLERPRNAHSGSSWLDRAGLEFWDGRNTAASSASILDGSGLALRLVIFPKSGGIKLARQHPGCGTERLNLGHLGLVVGNAAEFLGFDSKAERKSI
jgi:hypothetical protein